LNKNETQWDST